MLCMIPGLPWKVFIPTHGSEDALVEVTDVELLFNLQ